jgi:hypothetical protein
MKCAALFPRLFICFNTAMDAATRTRWKSISPWILEAAPALCVLSLTLLTSVLAARDISLLPALKTIWRIVFRFIRIALPLCLPLYALGPIYKLIAGKARKKLFLVNQRRFRPIDPLRNWVLRPLQGIGINFLFGTKLVAFLQLLTGSDSTALLLPLHHGQQMARLIMLTGVSVFVSLLLSVLWTLDDMGVRYFNRRDQEVKMLGKYVGTVMPLLFGTYGIYALLVHYPRGEALMNVFKTITILYPPFTIFVVAHARFVFGRMAYLSGNTRLRKGGIQAG